MRPIVIVGAGPAGLTAALELQKNNLDKIIIIEAESQVGGISKTVKYKGNRIDIGGHRFFSKSDWVMEWWQKLLPISSVDNKKNVELRYKGLTKKFIFSKNTKSKQSMLIRNRISRIYFNHNFFDYPLKPDFKLIKNLGISKTFIFLCSYLYSSLFPIKPEKNLEHFFINRFGKQLYIQFFKSYTEKVWGMPCNKIAASWGAQRIKSLSVVSAICGAINKFFNSSKSNYKKTSLIESFIYPKYGPGQMWEAASKKFIKQKGIIYLNSSVVKIKIKSQSIEYIMYRDKYGKLHKLFPSFFISTMPIKDLVYASEDYWSEDVQKIAKNLAYRDFITVGLLYDQIDFCKPLTDNWIYIQDSGVNVGRIQIFNNWSPYMVHDSSKIWLGLEFFCKESDRLWKMSNEKLIALAEKELFFLSMVKTKHSIDSVVLKVPKAYPGYFGSAYKKFHILQNKLDKIKNLFLIGRNGMHRYNNQDHSMLTAKEAVHQIVSGRIDKTKIWNINIDDDYHEEK